MSKSNILIFSSFFLGTLLLIFIFSNLFSSPPLVLSTISKDYIERPKENPKSILVFGDMMLDRNVANRMEEFGTDYPFTNIQSLLTQSDAVVANLEGVFTDNPSISREDRRVLRFTFDKKLLPTLKKFNFSILSQANNHTSDFGLEGAVESSKSLNEIGIQTFGDFFNRGDKVSSYGNFVFVGFNEFAYANADKVLDLIQKYNSLGNKVIVMPHWGEEYQGVSNERQRNLAKQFIDVGAFMVIGAHPHVVQEVELYNGHLIFYSLGNFIFDQDFSKETTEGLALQIIFGEKSHIELIPYNIIQSQVSLKNFDERELFLKELSAKSSEGIRGEIIKGKIESGM